MATSTVGLEVVSSETATGEGDFCLVVVVVDVGVCFLIGETSGIEVVLVVDGFLAVVVEADGCC